MYKKIVVSGMHCKACSELIRMELEENGFAVNIKSISLSENSKFGEITFQEISDIDFEKAISIINKIDEYSVTQVSNFQITN